MGGRHKRPMKQLSVTRAVYVVLDSFQEGIISGRELQFLVSNKTGKDPYHSTVLGKARDYCDITGAEMDCIDNKRSLYRFKPGVFKIENAIISGRE